MFPIHYLNPISPKGTALWTEDYQEVLNPSFVYSIVKEACLSAIVFATSLPKISSPVC